MGRMSFSGGRGARIPDEQVPQEVRYRGYRASAEGLWRDRGLLRWEDVDAVRGQFGVIGGYGDVTIEGRTRRGGRTAVTIKGETSEAYRLFLAALVRHAASARIDASVRRAAATPPAELRKDPLAIALFLLGAAVVLSAWWVIAWYSPTVFSSNIYPLLILPFGGIPAAAALLSFVSGSLGRPVAARWRLLASGLVGVGGLAAVGVFLLLSPFSLQWLLGDLRQGLGDSEAAVRHYESALGILPGSLDIHFELGKLYRRQGDWEQALVHLEKAYSADPTYWTASALELIPDTLLRMGRTEEAAAWCRRMRGDLAGRRKIALMLDRMEERIRAGGGRAD